MKKILPALLSATALLIAGTGSAQAANPVGTDYYMTPGSYMTITDHEPFGANEVNKFDLSNVYLGRINGETSKTITVSRCAGGEVRIDLELQLKRENDAINRFTATARMYEGASCSNNDYDGGLMQSGNAFYTRPSIGDTGTVKFEVKNKYEGGDHASLAFQLYGTRVY